MRIHASEREGIPVITPEGEYDGELGRQVAEMALPLMQGGHRCILLELAGVERIYAAGISELLRLQREAACRNVRLICCSVRPYIRELLRITLLDRSLEMQADLESALDLTREAV